MLIEVRSHGGILGPLTGKQKDHRRRNVWNRGTRELARALGIHQQRGRLWRTARNHNAPMAKCLSADLTGERDIRESQIRMILEMRGELGSGCFEQLVFGPGRRGMIWYGQVSPVRVSAGTLRERRGRSYHRSPAQ